MLNQGPSFKVSLFQGFNVAREKALKPSEQKKSPAEASDYEIEDFETLKL